ncbi:MAG: NAD(P)-dependent alcohol dehydrogenase [Gaiellaceae bacterium]
MKAVVHEKYGPPEVLRVRDVQRPTPAGGEVLVHVRASTVTRTDCGLRRASPFFIRFFTGLLRPKHTIAGMEFAGEVAAIGADVTEFSPGDRVFGVKQGSNAEYVCVKERGAIARMPEGVSSEQAAAAADGGCSALSTLRQARLQAGQRVVVYGASGSIGTAAVQVAKHQGAHVTAVCGPDALDLARSLGAEEVVDYTRADYAGRGETYDLVFDAVGKSSYRRCRRALIPDGLYITMDGGFMWHAPFLALVSKRVKLGVARYRQEDVATLASMLEAGDYRPVIDRTYPLEEVVEATRYVETGQKTGNVVLGLG